MPRGMNFHSMFRDGTRRYTSRPPSNCRSARAAWDHHVKDGPIIWLQLLDGYWGACRQDGDIDEVENKLLFIGTDPMADVKGSHNSSKAGPAVTSVSTGAPRRRSISARILEP